MFRRSAPAEDAAATDAQAQAEAAAAAGKGRPTPTRKEAEAARKAALKVPSDPKAAKKALRERERAERVAARAALSSGDEKHLPARDAGPVRAYVRDYVDKRRSMGEIFVPMAVVVLVLGFVRNPVVVVVTYYAWLVMMVLVALDIVRIIVRLGKALKEQWPDKADRKGALFYAGMRSLTLRKLRLPPPRFKAGGKPVAPKAPKPAKAR